MRTNTSCVRVAITVGVALGALGCEPQEERPGALGAMAPPPDNPVTCTTYGSDEATAEIGAAGGSVAAAHGVDNGERRHELVVPAGAIEGNEELTFRLREPQNGYLNVIATHTGGDRRFDRELTLRISYSGCDVTDPTSLVMLRWLGGAEGWVAVPDYEVNEDAMTVSAPRDTLSQYALGAG